MDDKYKKYNKYKLGENGELIKVANYDTKYMLYFNKVLPDDPKLAEKLLIKVNGFVGRIRQKYNARTNSALIRKIFMFAFNLIVTDILEGKGYFLIPGKNKKWPLKIKMGSYSDGAVKKRIKETGLPYIDISKNDYKLPRLEFQFSPRDTRVNRGIYVDVDLYQKAVDVVNSGGRFKNLPLYLEDYYEITCDKFSCIKPKSVKKILRVGFNEIVWHLKKGEIIIFEKTEHSKYMKIYTAFPSPEIFVNRMRDVVNKRNYRIKHNFQRKVKIDGV